MLALFLPALLLIPVPDSPGQAPWWAGLDDRYGWRPLPLIPAGLLLAGAAVPEVSRGPRLLRRHPRVTAGGGAVLLPGVVAGAARLRASADAATAQLRTRRAFGLGTAQLLPG